MVSVVIAALNEEAFIGRLLDQLVVQTYPRDRLEIVIADGGSTDRTRVVIADRQAVQGESPRVVLTENPERVPSTGFNAAIRASSGDVILLVGGHAEVPPDFVEASVDSLKASGADLAGGWIETRGRTPKGRAIALAQSSRFGVGGNVFRTGRANAGPVDTVPFGAYRRDVFDRFGWFDPRMVGAADGEFNFRLRRLGGSVWFDPAIRSVYFCRETYLALARQYYLYGRGKGWISRDHGRLPSMRQAAPPLFVLGLLFSALASVASRQLRFAFPVAAAGYGAVVVVAAARTATDSASAPRVALAYPCMHLPYGVGFLRGLAAGPAANVEPPRGTTQ
jgi:glycosyltransferase involved in cell wall biosynthesis